MSAYNFRLHEFVVEAVMQAILDQTQYLIDAVNDDFGSLRHRQGIIHGLQEALAVAEAVRKKHLEG